MCTFLKISFVLALNIQNKYLFLEKYVNMYFFLEIGNLFVKIRNPKRGNIYNMNLYDKQAQVKGKSVVHLSS